MVNILNLVTTLNYNFVSFVNENIIRYYQSLQLGYDLVSFAKGLLFFISIIVYLIAICLIDTHAVIQKFSWTVTFFVGYILIFHTSFVSIMFQFLI